MATYGLVIRDANGNVKINITDRITRYIGDISTGTAAGSFVIPGSGDGWYAIIDAVPIGNSSNLPPQVTYDAGSRTISWSWATTQYGVRAVTIRYGVY